MNSFPRSIQFTYQTEKNNSISFLDIELLRVGENIGTRVFLKPTNTDLYIHHLKTLAYRGCILCSDENHLHLELKYLRKVFHQNNGYQHCFINRVFGKVKNDFTRQQTLEPLQDTAVLNDVRKQTLLQRYAGQNCCTLVKSLKTHLKKTLLSNVKADIVYTRSKLSCKSNLKGKTPFEEQHDLLYRAVCATANCTEDYVWETARRIVERAKDHNGQDQHSHLVIHAIENKHLPVLKDDSTILDSGYRKNTRKRKIAEGLMIKAIRLSLNFKEKSVEKNFLIERQLCMQMSIQELY